MRDPRLSRPQLKFTPYAWAKLVWMRDAGPTEIGGFGITPSDDPLLIYDIQLVRQQTTEVSVAFDDGSVADLFDELVDSGLRPEQFGRIWIHTHPGASPSPSCVDEETFQRCFGNTDWSLMFIIAQAGATYGRLKFNSGPGGALRVATSVDWQGQRVLTCFSRQDLQQELVVPGAASSFHGDARFLRVLLEK